MLEHYQERFRFILIDEYQDNQPRSVPPGEPAGVEAPQHLRGGGRRPGHLLVAGATIQNLDFEHDYPDAQEFILDQNCRSTRTILEVANALIEHNVQRKPKSLWTESEHGSPVVRTGPRTSTTRPGSWPVRSSTW